MNERSSRKNPASSSDGLAVFQAYIDLINSERETLWARHNALLLANSLILGSLAMSPTVLWENKWVALAMLGAGLVMCAAWFLITVEGSSTMQRHADLAGSFASSCFAHLPNPFCETICNRRQAAIHRLTLLMIGLFTLLYLGLGYVRLASV